MQIEIASPYDKMAESGSSLLRLIQNNDTNKLDLLVREALQNCLDAVLNGVSRVHIMDGRIALMQVIKQAERLM